MATDVVPEEEQMDFADESDTQSIRDSVNQEARQSEKDEVESVYSELDQSMQQLKARHS